MTRGPLPQPDAVKRARGNPGKRKLADPAAAAPAVPVGDAKPSGKLRPAGRHVWNALAPELARLNILRGTDSGALSRYCDDVATYWEVSEKLRKMGLTYEVKSNHGQYHRINPLFVVQERIASRLVTMEDRFGLSPQARQALMVRAAQLAGQGQLPFGTAPSPGQPPAPEPASPVGLLGAPNPTTH